MEQIREYIPLITAFMIGVVFTGSLLPVKERIIFTHCNCLHGFENEEDCKKYITGEQDELHRLQDSD